MYTMISNSLVLKREVYPGQLNYASAQKTVYICMRNYRAGQLRGFQGQTWFWPGAKEFPSSSLSFHTHTYIHTDNVKCSTYLLGLIENVMSVYTQ